MRSVHFFLPAVLLAVTIVTCTPPPAEEAIVDESAAKQADLDAIAQLGDGFVKAMNTSDIEVLVGSFTDDAIRMPPNEPSIVGTAALRSHFQALFEQADSTVTILLDETEVAGEWAYSRGTYTLEVRPKGEGEPEQDNGKWLNILQRQTDGSWKISCNIWNSDNPIPGAGPG